ncbi:MAG: Hint domain-containing protein [Sedimentitalea sp.]
MSINTVLPLGTTTPRKQPVTGLYGDQGFAPDTVVLTQKGEMPVQALSAGDRVITRDAGLVSVQHVSSSRHVVRTVAIKAGSLGDTRPDQDMILPANQAILIRDWRAQALFGCDQAMVRADALVDGEFVRDLGLQDMILHQIHLAHPHVVYAGGLELANCAMPTATLRRRA